MNLIRGIALTVVAFTAAAGPAGAQEPDWIRDLERQAAALARIIEQQVTGGGRQPRGRQGDARGAEATEQVSRTLRLGRNGTLDVQNVAGDIVITGAGGDDVRVEAIKRTRGQSDADRRALLKETQVVIAERAGNVEVRTEYPRRRNVSASVDYTVTVPRAANVIVRTMSGNVRVTNVRGELRAESVNGDITTADAGRVRELRSVSGTIEVTDAEGEDVEGRTLNGDLIVTNLKARALEFASVSGNMRFTGIESDRASMQSINGDIDFAGQFTRSGRYEFSSHSGDIRITPAGSVGFDVEASTLNGTVRSDYALKGFQTPGLALRGGLNRRLRGTFGEAAAALILQTFNGDITLVKR